MALFEEKEPMPIDPEVEAVEPKIYPKAYQGIAIDTKYSPKSSMLQWINGSNWRVNYFSQNLKGNQEPTPLDINRQPPYQTYRRIMNINIKVSQPLDISQDERIRTFSVTGSGHMYPGVTANQGDMIVGDIGDGRLGLFTVTSAIRETFLNDSTFAIQWKMIGFLNDTYFNDLTRKTIMTFHWSQNNLLAGCSPFVTEEAYNDAIEFGKQRKEIIRRWISDFFSIEHSTFLVPDQMVKTYDHFVTKAMIAMVDTITDQRMRRVKLLNVMSEPVMKQPTVWDALLYQDSSRLCGATERAHLVSTRISRWRPELQAIGYTGIPRFVFPIEASTDVDSQYNGYNNLSYEGVPFEEGKPRRMPPGILPTQLERNEPWFKRLAPNEQSLDEAWRTPATIKPVVIDNYYVFSEAFYFKDAVMQSKLEQLTWAMINREPLKMDQLKDVMRCCFEWDNLERFYYHPILIALLKYALRN